MLQQWGLRLKTFLMEELWRNQPRRPKGLRGTSIRYLRVIVHAALGFQRDLCNLKASTLTYYSLLSFVPIVAVVFAIAKGFGIRKFLEKSMMDKFSAHEAVLHEIISNADLLLESTRGGLIAGVGIIFLFWTVIKVLGYVEGAFNDIWQIRNSRSLSRKFSDYVSMMVIAPHLFIISSSVAIFLTAHIRTITEGIYPLGIVAPAIYTALSYSPYVIIWILFTFTYIFMPNTRVRFRSALFAGVVAGTAFQWGQYGYLHFQVSVMHHNAIYGSLTALPLFLVWLNISWVVVLFGAELSHAHQRLISENIGMPYTHLSIAQERLIALRIIHFIIKRFERGEKAPKVVEIADYLGRPPWEVQKIVRKLSQVHLISAIPPQDSEPTIFQPAEDIRRLTIYRVIEAIDNFGATPLTLSETPESKQLIGALGELNKAMCTAHANQCLKDI
jgi:membrane protein